MLYLRDRIIELSDFFWIRDVFHIYFWFRNGPTTPKIDFFDIGKAHRIYVC